MKQFVTLIKPATMLLMVMTPFFSQPSFAGSGKPGAVSTAPVTSTETSFSIELNRQIKNELILLTIKNPGRRNLYVTLNGPGGTVDDFYTGKRLDQLTKSYNFTGAEPGVYTIVVSDHNKKIQKEIRLEPAVVQPVTLTVQ